MKQMIVFVPGINTFSLCNLENFILAVFIFIGLIFFIFGAARAIFLVSSWWGMRKYRRQGLFD